MLHNKQPGPLFRAILILTHVCECQGFKAKGFLVILNEKADRTLDTFFFMYNFCGENQTRAT